MPEFIKGILIILFIFYQFFGILVAICLIDCPDIVPNPNKRNLAKFLMGPTSWFISIIHFLISIIKHIIRNIFLWFKEE